MNTDHRFHIEHGTLDLAKQGHRGAFAHIREQCHRYVTKWHAADLSMEAVEEIIQAAITAWLPILLSEDEHSAVVKKLKTILDRFKKSEKRHQKRMQLRDTEDVISWGNIGPHLNIPEFLEEAEHFIHIVGIIEEHMLHALHALSQRDHDIIVDRYGLEGHGHEFEIHHHGHLKFPSDDAERKAISRAIKRFGDHLVHSIHMEIRSLKHITSAPAQERVLTLQEALRLTDHASLPEILESVEDLEEVRRAIHPPPRPNRLSEAAFNQGSLFKRSSQRARGS